MLLPIDTSRLQFLVAVTAEPLRRYEEGEPRELAPLPADANSEIVWRVQLVPLGDGEAEADSKSDHTRGLWTARRVAAHYGVSASFVYQRADELGCIRLGGGKCRGFGSIEGCGCPMTER